MKKILYEEPQNDFYRCQGFWLHLAYLSLERLDTRTNTPVNAWPKVTEPHPLNISRTSREFLLTNPSTRRYIAVGLCALLPVSGIFPLQRKHLPHPFPTLCVLPDPNRLRSEVPIGLLELHAPAYLNAAVRLRTC